MKNQKGITLVSLIVTIILVLILSTVGLNASLSAYRNMKLQNFIAKMKVIQEKVNTIKDNYRNWEGYNQSKEQDEGYYKDVLGFEKPPATEKGNFEVIIGKICDYYDVEDKNNVTEILQKVPSFQASDADFGNYYYFDSKAIEEKLDIKNIDEIKVLINFATGNVIELNGVSESGNSNVKIYRLYDYGAGNQLIVSAKNDGKIIIKSEIIKNYGLKKRVKISLVSNKTIIKGDGTTENIDVLEDEIPLINKVYYKVANTVDGTGNLILPNNWTDAYQLENFEFINNEAYFNLNITGKYIFKVITYNNESYEQKIDIASAIDESIDIQLCNPPILVEGMKPVYWDESKETASQLTEVSDINSPLWYDYSSTQNRWANVQTEDGSLWVWIPRYAVDNIITPTKFEFLTSISNTTTNNLKTFDKELVQKIFTEDGEITGIWVAKFQGKYDFSKNITSFIPGTSLANTTALNAKSYCKNTIIDSEKIYARLMNDNSKKAITDLTSILGITISTSSNNNYAGGGSSQYTYVSKGIESSTSNVYGIYDLKAGIEITANSTLTDEGRYRSIAYSTETDFNNPTVSVSQTSVEQFSVSVQVTASDKESGLGTNPTYNYYIKPSSEATYPTNPITSTQSTNYTFTGLMHNTNYDVKVTVSDMAGNIGIGYVLNIKTNKYITIQYLKDTQETVESNTTLEDGRGGKIVIPIACTVAPDSSIYVSEGVVIITPDGSEWVWVPVTDINSMARATSGTDSNGLTNYQGKLYNFSYNGYTEHSSYGQGTEKSREPSLVTGNAADTSAILTTITGTSYDAKSSYYSTILGFGSAQAFGQQMQNDFNEMVTNVQKYGGFYVARYETSINPSGIAQSKKGAEPTSAETVPEKSWYGLYKVQKKYATDNDWTNFIGSSMIWGCQYDQMLIWMQKNGVKVTYTEPVSDTDGNGYVRNTTSICGNEIDDKLNNVYDLLGNRREMTMEAYGSNIRVRRSGDKDDEKNITLRQTSGSNAVPTYSGSYTGSRMTFYLK